MSWYRTRTDAELVALAASGDRTARALLVDRTLLPASRVAVHLQHDTDAAVGALVGAYRDALRRAPGLDDADRFLPVLLERLDAHARFPLDPATHAALDPLDRDRVRAAVLGRRAPSRRAVPLVALLVAALVGGIAWAATVDPDGAPEGAPPPGRVTAPTSGDDPTPAVGGRGGSPAAAGWGPYLPRLPPGGWASWGRPIVPGVVAFPSEPATTATEGPDEAPIGSGEGTGTGELAETR